MLRWFVLAGVATLALAAGGYPADVPLVRDVSAGGDHTCAVTAKGGAECWGLNREGQLGDGTTTNRLTPVPVLGLEGGVQQVAAGGGHACALENGRVECWGWNGDGQLGDGTTENRLRPVSPADIHEGATSVAAGESNTCAVTTSGGVECWGRNDYGELGDGSDEDSSRPVPVSGLSSGARSISVGEIKVCALTTSGSVLCWGARPLGDGTNESSAVPVRVTGLGGGVVAVSAGGTEACALTAGGGVKCWGYNDSGELGDGTKATRMRPVPVTGLSSGVQAISAGESHACALETGGKVVCWGSNSSGELGDGTYTDRTRPVAVKALPAGVRAISAGASHTCAVLSDGSYRCWGSNYYGQLGNGSKTVELSVRLAGHGTVRARGFVCAQKECSREYAPGTSVSLREHPARGWKFKRWTGACKGHANRCRVSLRKDTSVRGIFARR